MSTDAISAVWALRRPDGAALSSGERLVLLRLAEVAHSDGTNAFLSVATIAEDCDLDRRSVQRSLGELVKRGVLAVQHPARQHRPTVYRLTVPHLRGVAEEVLLDTTTTEPVPIQQRQNAAPESEAVSAQQRQNAAPESLPGAAQGRRRGGAGAAYTPPDPDPDPELKEKKTNTGANAERARSAIAEGATATAVKHQLLALREKFTIAPVSVRQEQIIDEYSDSLTLEDINRAEREYEAGIGWGYVVSVLGRVAANRRNHVEDAWAFGIPPRPAGAGVRRDSPPGARTGRLASAAPGAGADGRTDERRGWAPPRGAVGLDG